MAPRSKTPATAGKASPLSPLSTHGICLWSIITAIAMGCATYLAQRYRMSELEECYIFIFDNCCIARQAARAGGPAQLLASFLTQFMGPLWVGPTIVGAIYGIITGLLMDIGRRHRAATWSFPLALLPALFLAICLENSTYKFQGHAALAIVVVLLWARGCRRSMSFTGTCLLTALCYWLAGSAALVFAIASFLLDVAARRRHRWAGVLYTAVYAVCAYTAFRCQAVPTMTRAFTPGMYYEWESTYFMMLYTWIGTVAAVAAMAFIHKNIKGGALVAAAILLAECAGAVNLGINSHNPAIYRTQKQRFHSKRGQWDKILEIDYGPEGTPFTSYRTLALAHKGRLVDELVNISPFIDYYMKNTQLVKREDVQVLSDVFYACDYMGAARHFAFDTDIVTPGEFNPYETLKLARINIAYGDYAVADKLLGKLEKTLRYASEARTLRRFLYNDAAVEADPSLGAKRRAIPEDNSYMSPRKTGEQLKYITEQNPDQLVALQYYYTFQLLTGIK